MISWGCATSIANSTEGSTFFTSNITTHPILPWEIISCRHQSHEGNLGVGVSLTIQKSVTSWTILTPAFCLLSTRLTFPTPTAPGLFGHTCLTALTLAWRQSPPALYSFWSLWYRQWVSPQGLPGDFSFHFHCDVKATSHISGPCNLSHDLIFVI